MGAIIAFGLIAAQVVGHGPLAVADVEIAQALHRQAAQPLLGWMRLVSLLHSPGASGVLALPLAAVFWWRRDYGWLLMAALCLPGGMLLNELIKLIFQRGRPLLEQPLVVLTSYSFPSGHTAAATVLYGLAACYAVTLTRRAGHLGPKRDANPGANRAANRAAKWTAALAVSTALSLVALVGYSRMYLGAHYLSDVLAAFAEGCGWLALCLTLKSALARRGGDIYDTRRDTRDTRDT
ncbi:phosphatase PAP2 family protein [Rugamonas sp.]|uniref:phosphatase PAP2 family protein n=1 Tax=Rugamonas sp. TaxID=1926287 RepID=UPI0025DB25E8|nr:phosphatase PAP2 family protein [Rugamonas sp.]